MEPQTTAPLAVAGEGRGEAKTAVQTAECSSLAERINAEHELAAGKAREAIEHARRAGEYLQQAKAAVGHGNWMSWLSTNCPHIHERKAERYMALAKGWNDILAKSDNVSDLTVSGALQL